MIRPVMSALISTDVLASIFPLAVTALTRSRRATFSIRTSVPANFFLCDWYAIPPPAAAARATTIKPIFMPRDMWLPQLTKGTTDRGLQRRDRLVVVVDRVHVITFGSLDGVLGIRDLERGTGAEPIAVLGQPQL